MRLNKLYQFTIEIRMHIMVDKSFWAKVEMGKRNCLKVDTKFYRKLNSLLVKYNEP